MKGNQADLVDMLDGMRAAEEAANRAQAGWSDRALEALVEVGHTLEHFTIEDLREKAGVESPTDERAWGGVVKRAARLGIIRKVGYAPAKSSHGSPKLLWKCEPVVAFVRGGA